jgi:serine protein kinase
MAKNKEQKTQNVFDLLDSHIKNIDVQSWEGTFRDYLPMVIANPFLNELAHSRVLRMIESHGITYDEFDEKKEHPRYNFFSRELFGLENSAEKFVNYLRAAATGSEVSKRILLVYGPTSSGKSQTAILIKRGLEAFSKTAEGAVYAIADCPQHENPMSLIPHSVRADMRNKYNLHIEGELCPVCSMNLKTKYNNDIYQVPVKRIFFSEKDRVGIGTFLPSDTKSQDISELVGSIDLSTIGEYGTEADPRAYKFNGELNVANRGIMEMIEMLKVDPKFLYVLLTLAQEKTIKTGRFPLIYADEFLFAHTNETEYDKFLGKKELEALHDRMIVLRMPYNLKLDEEQKIYDKLIKQGNFSNVHIAPNTLLVASLFAVLSRLIQSKNLNLTLMKKIRLYNGDNVDGFTKQELSEIMHEDDKEGMFGISPRYIMNCLSNTISKNNVKCISPIDAIREIKDGFDSNPKLSKKDIDSLGNFITMAMEEFNKIAKREVKKAFFVNFEHEIYNLLSNYIDHIEAYLDNSTVVDEFGERREPNERLLRAIEEKIEITSSGKDSFRAEVLRKMMKTKVETGKYDLNSHAKLREALENQLFDERADTIKITVSARNPSEEELKKKNVVIATLIEEQGYCVDCSNQLLRYVQSVLSRG